MPFYEYKCKDCGCNFEQLVSISEASKKQVCPHCGKKNTEKQLSVFAAKSSSPSFAAPSGGGFT
jgi:putative FmdB family regulatory protein